MLSDWNDIIVITDEAHRSQYDILAMNMRTALPNAAFLGFTGTPLISSEQEKTREVFGDYVSVYNFSQSIEDRATVPLYYQDRIPEVMLNNDHFSEELYDILEIKSDDTSTLFFAYKEKFYALDRNQETVTSLEEIIDQETIQRLESIRNQN